MALPKISTTGATLIGDMTAYGGLAAAINGSESQAAASCAGKNSAMDGYTGIGFPAPTAVAVIEIRGSNNYGYCGAQEAMTFNRWSSATAPSNSSNGSLVGSIGITNYPPLGNRIRRIFALPAVALVPQQYHWIEQAAGVGSTMLMGQLRFYGPYPAETITAGPAGALPEVIGLRAESDGGDVTKMWISGDEAILANPLDGRRRWSWRERRRGHKGGRSRNRRLCGDNWCGPRSGFCGKLIWRWRRWRLW